MRRQIQLGARTLAAGLLLFSLACAHQNATPPEPWVGAWTASAQPANTGLPGIPPGASLQDQTVRNVIRPTLWGSKLRVRISNEHGTRPLHVGQAAATIRTQGSQIDETTRTALTVEGAASFVIPEGTSALTDGIDISGWPQGDIAVDLYFPEDTGEPTWHWAALETSYVSNAGNFVGSAQFSVATPTTSRFFVSGLEVVAPNTSAIVALGDSITEGTVSTLDGYQRWPDLLAARVKGRAVLNQGIGGNRLLHDVIGTAGIRRFDRDVLTPAGVKYAIIGLGINDLGLWQFLNRPDGKVSASQIIDGYRDLIGRGRERGLKIYGATLTPIGTSFVDSPENQDKWQQVNDWIRSTAGTTDGFDAVIDFDAAVRDPEQPRQLRAAFDSGDHLHPNDAGNRAMADAIDLRLFE